MLSLGLPMILMGDEIRRTQLGNNNAYCQDNAIGWLDWTLAVKHADVLRFISLLNARRHLQDVDPAEEHLSLSRLLRRSDRAWHGVKLGQPDWSVDSHSLALSVAHSDGSLHLIFNAYWDSLEFELPPVTRGTWRRWIDTSLDSPNDIVEWQDAPPVAASTYRAGPRSVVALIGTGPEGRPVERS